MIEVGLDEAFVVDPDVDVQEVDRSCLQVVVKGELDGGVEVVAVHYVHFVKYDDAVSFYDAVSDTIRRRGGNRGIFTEEGVDTVAYFGGNHGSRV